MGEPITLHPVTYENWRDVVALELTPEQIAGDFLNPNVDSLAEAYVHPGFVPRAIHAGEQLVGFVMWLEHTEGDGLEWFSGERRPEYWIARFMIDKSQQGNGYGRRAMETVIDEMKSSYDCREINLSYHADNIAAISLYDSLGFEPFTTAPWGETVARLRLDPNAT